MAYKTPGVYVKEKSIFPPSVAEVETAIPAFIGYTEIAMDKSPNDLINKPKRISSMPDFRRYFGGAPNLSISAVNLDANNKLTGASVDPMFYLFYSMQLFFMNGGGDCYVVSVGKYKKDDGSDNSVELGDRSASDDPGLDVGLAALEKEDEPTMIVFPDAVLLDQESDFYTLQKNALSQCGNLMDRVAILDLRSNDIGTLGSGFRDKIGTNQLKYGAAYSPYLKTGFIDDVRYKDFLGNLNRESVSIGLDKLTNEPAIKTHIQRLGKAIDDVSLIKSDIGSISFPSVDTSLNGNIRGIFKALMDEQTGDYSATTFKRPLNFLYDLVELADNWFFKSTGSHTSDSGTDGTGDDNYRSYQTDAHNAEFDSFQAAAIRLVSFDKAADEQTGPALGTFKLYEAHQANLNDIDNYDDAVLDWDGNLSAPPTKMVPSPFTFDPTLPNDAAKKKAMRDNGLPVLASIFEDIMASIEALRALGDTRQTIIDDSLQELFPAYKNLLSDLRNTLSEVPPSGAIAGVYARVDANRGVWKAPANVSLNGVSDLSYKFTKSETDRLNVDTNFGKSINAIQFMTGMGYMVWGARTLAGNDNEWRYISVRRFFNMVEESCKKSTMWAVFEPNDANTWVKVKGMIDNFLTLQWRNGALQGAKPEDAFYVKVGLGETMTPIDILEGRMNVEIGMAVVRPAEFIILTFMHKMVESG